MIFHRLASSLLCIALSAATAQSQITVDDSRSFTTSPEGTMQRSGPYTFQTAGSFDPTLESGTIPGALHGFNPVGSDKLIVTFSAEKPVGVESITYAGRELNQAVESENGGQLTGIYYLDNPGAVGDLVFKFSKDPNGVGGSVMAVSSVVLGPSSAIASAPGQSVEITTKVADPLVVASHVNNGSGATIQAPFAALFDGPSGSSGGGSGYLNPAPAGTITVSFDGSTTRPATAVASFAPTLPINPVPNGGIIRGGEVALSWQNLAPKSGDKVWVDVWFGTDPENLTQVASAAPDGLNQTSFITEPLDAGTYYWRVDSYLAGSPSGTPTPGTLLTFTIIDSDLDGLPDEWEQTYSELDSPTAVHAKGHLDADKLTNMEEFVRGTDPTKADSDGDGLDDHVETNTGIFVDAADTGTDPLNPDTDGDGLIDNVETNTGTFASSKDTGTDPLRTDTDGDGLSDQVETNTGNYISRLDTGSDPHKVDTDGDGIGDWYEASAAFTDPSDKAEAPGLPYPLPDPDPADLGAADKPVQVYIMSGQSNTVGIGYVNGDEPGSLETIAKREGKFPNLVDDSGNWTERKDVIYKGVVTATAEGPLTAGQGADASRIGPELGFGHVMGWFHDEPVLILKASQGNRSLGWDFLPPGSERFQVGELTYAGYGDRPSSWLTDSEGPVPGVWYAGKQYDDCLRDEADMGMPTWTPAYDYNKNTLVKHKGQPYAASSAHTSGDATEPGVGADWKSVWSQKSMFNAADILGDDGTLQHLPKDGNDLNGRRYEIAGFCWWQGHKDGGQQGTGEAGVHAARYEKNLVALIDALRKDFNAPDAPVVVATVGFGGGTWEPGSSGDTIFKAQMAVGDPDQHPDLAENVASVDTTGFWRTLSESPGGQGFHYNNNAETYMLVGDAMGRAMLELKE